MAIRYAVTDERVGEHPFYARKLLLEYGSKLMRSEAERDAERHMYVVDDQGSTHVLWLRPERRGYAMLDDPPRTPAGERLALMAMGQKLKTHTEQARRQQYAPAVAVVHRDWERQFVEVADALGLAPQRSSGHAGKAMHA